MALLCHLGCPRLTEVGAQFPSEGDTYLMFHCRSLAHDPTPSFEPLRGAATACPGVHEPIPHSIPFAISWIRLFHIDIAPPGNFGRGSLPLIGSLATTLHQKYPFTHVTPSKQCTPQVIPQIMQPLVRIWRPSDKPTISGGKAR